MKGIRKIKTDPFENLIDHFKDFERKIFMLFNTCMGKTFLFRFFNVIFWSFIVYILNKKGFKCSFEYFLMKLFFKINLKLSIKMNP